MSNVTEFPLHRLSDGELRLREWETVMAHGFGSLAHQRLKDEIGRRSPEVATLHPRPLKH